ncbi:protein FAM133 [Sorghum bicolor]|uniref:Uncharacterized protein n=1 Tax=Sorghum bicolor TaxID=4558 RepID=C5Z391_SORBI|nr:protein FAM133 [Sorghum bicolor]EER87768.1 hypothetical protein SORBI_3010G019400 [Sorghum bicolor]|eukprot:XP_002436401.1 protein FAM133 [Sorghum bicolor]
MPGKGQRRREKNFQAAHGGDTRLPPPPKHRELEAIPSKLRRLIAFQNKHNANADASSGGAAGKQDGGLRKNRPATERTPTEKAKDKKIKKQILEAPADSKASEIKGSEDGSAANENVNAEGSKGKRKRGKAKDLRFEELDKNISVSKKQRRKQHLNEKKKKRKGNKAETVPDFPGREKVKFGEVVQAPPKLSFPKVKSALDASREMLRKEAIENYRNIKGWTSRPGLKLPTLAENTFLSQ